MASRALAHQSIGRWTVNLDSGVSKTTKPDHLAVLAAEARCQNLGKGQSNPQEVVPDTAVTSEGIDRDAQPIAGINAALGSACSASDPWITTQGNGKSKSKGQNTSKDKTLAGKYSGKAKAPQAASIGLPDDHDPDYDDDYDYYHDY